MKDQKTTILIAVAAVAALLAIYTGWRTFGPSRGSQETRSNSQAGRISPMSSMLGPDASGRPRTDRNDGTPMNGMSRNGAPMSHMPGGR